MRTLIVYYSRTGHARAVAEALGNALDAELAEVRCDRYRGGLWRYLRAGYDSVKGNLPPVEGPTTAPDTYDQLVIGGPVWTAHPALPIRTFLSKPPTLPQRIALFLTCGGHSSPERAFAEMEALLPAPAVATLALRDDEIDKGALSTAIEGFAATLGHRDAA